MPIRNHVITVDTAVINVIDRTVLLIRRGRGAFEGRLALPGGLVECDERVVEAAQRELAEETGIHIALNRFKFHRYSDKQYANPRKDRVGMFFYVEVFSNFVVEGADDATEAMWMDWYEALNANLAFDHEEVLRELVPEKQTRYSGGC